MKLSADATSGCDYCGLPLPGAGRESDSDRPSDDSPSSAPVYCCFGCGLAASISAQRDKNSLDGEGRDAGVTLARLGIAVFFTMNVMVFSLALWAGDVYRFDAGDHAQATLHELFRYACLLFSGPVVLILGVPLLRDVVSQWRRRVVTTDLLLVVGVFAAFLYSVAAIVRGDSHTYFEVGCMVLVAVTLGRWFEAVGKWRTTRSLRGLRKLLPERVRRVDASDRPDALGQEVELRDIRPGDLIRVLPGERIPVDGRIESGCAAVDQQLVTGEGFAVTRQAADRVFGGTLNTDGDLLIRVTAGPEAGTLQRLVDAVQDALSAKGPESRLADRLTRWFLPIVFAVSTATFVWHASAADFAHGLMSGLAVVLIACPCALGIATPLAVWVAMGEAARRQVLVRDGDALSRLARVRSVLLDKTGTLTTGSGQVERCLTDGETPREKVLLAAASVAARSTHGYSRAITRAAGHHERDVSDLRALPGRGLTARVQDLDETVYLGSLRFLEEAGQGCGEALRLRMRSGVIDGQPSVGVAWAGRVRGVFLLREQLRPGVEPAVRDLLDLGLWLEILSGDDSDRARRVAEQLGVSFRSGLLPEEKLAIVRELRQRRGPVAMIGDGINDAPALAEADVGIAMGCGADVTRDAGDVCLLSDDLTRVAWAIGLARRTTRVVRQNLFWALAYNVVGIGLAASGTLNPIVAAIAMVGSSFFVVSNSLRLAGPADPSLDAATSPADPATADPARRASSGDSDPAEVVLNPMN